MGVGALPNITAPVATQTHNNDIRVALRGTLYGRNSSSGDVQAGEDVGSITVPWGTGYFQSGLVINGQPVNFNIVTAEPNRIVSGETRTASGQPDFLRADGTALTAEITADITDLVVTIEGVEATFSADVSLTSLASAPATNNTALVNENRYAGEAFTKYVGENKNTLNIDAAGSEWTSRVGQIIAFKVGASDEIAIGYLKSATEITQCYRGYFFDDAGLPLVRNTLSDNDTLTILSLGWVYANNTGTTASISYTTPIYSGVEPSSPANNDYWYDLINKKWLVYNGTDFIDANSTLIGLVVMNTTACIATRSFDFDAGFQDTLAIDIAVKDDVSIQITNKNAVINVYGNEFYLPYNTYTWNITTDLETGLTEANDTLYYCYITEQGKPIISLEYPYLRPDLKGYYHPYNSWRYIGRLLNNSAGDIDFAINYEVKNEKKFLLAEYRYKTGDSFSIIDIINLHHVPFELLPFERSLLDIEWDMRLKTNAFSSLPVSARVYPSNNNGVSFSVSLVAIVASWGSSPPILKETSGKIYNLLSSVEFPVGYVYAGSFAGNNYTAAILNVNALRLELTTARIFQSGTNIKIYGVLK